MKVEFLKKFSKDIDDLKIKSVKNALLQQIHLIETLDSFEKIPHINKLKGHKAAYRIRIGDYRSGFFYDNSIITFARFVHRKDIYKIFP